MAGLRALAAGAGGVTSAAAAAARHVCLAAQPRSVHGSPDTLVTRGVDATLAVTAQLAEAIVRAVSGKSSAKAIEAAIESTAKGFGTRKLAAPIERELLHGALLGAADSWFETKTGSPVKVETFATLHGATGKLLEDIHRMVLSDRTFLASDTGFAGRPIKEAINAFLKKKAVTRDVFDAMEKEAQRRAFTVAGMANDAMVSTVKRELIRQVAVGADLREFGKNAAKRFEAAGWTPANPSHVETVFRTNVMGAYSGGRVRQMTQPEVLAVRPYWQSLSVGDGPPRQRPTHRTFVLLASDPFWQEASPPYGYNCRCRLRSLSVKQGAPMVQSGSSIHGLPDPGFTSGVASLFEAGPEPSREPPANDTGGPAQAPANDPPPRQRPANDDDDRVTQQRPEPKPEERGIAVGYDERGNLIDAFGDRTEPDEKPKRKSKPKPKKPAVAPDAGAPEKKADDEAEARRKKKADDDKREAEVEAEAQRKKEAAAEQAKKDKAEKAEKDRAEKAAQQEIEDSKKKKDAAHDEPQPVSKPAAEGAPQREAAKKMSLEDARKGYEDANVFGTHKTGLNGGSIQIKGENAHAVRHEVYKALDEVGFSKFFGGPIPTDGSPRRMRALVLTEDISEFQNNEHAQLPLNTIMKGSSGSNQTGIHLIKIDCTPRDVGRHAGSAIDSAWGVSDTRKTNVEQIKSTAIHEFGHSVAMDKSCAPAEWKAVDKLVKKEFKANGKILTKYGSTTHDEFFAESFAAYHQERAWLKTNKPSVFKMVEDVLQLKGML
jgi:hypothetical protein